MRERVSRGRPAGMVRIIASAGVLLLAGVAGTAAAFTDAAKVNLGNGTPGSGIGNPDRFDIAVRDAKNALQDADTAATAVVLDPASGAELSESEPLVFEARFENRDPGVDGDLTIRLYDPDDTGSGDLFEYLLFDLTLQGAGTPVASGMTAAEINAANLTETEVAPGGTLDVTLEAVVAPGSPITLGGLTTQIGIRVEGESR